MRLTSRTLVKVGMSAAIVLFLTTRGTADPGQPFGDDDAGCVPDTIDHLRCADTIAKAVGKLVAGVIKCHVQQADAAFKTGTAGLSDEECEEGGSPKSALGRFTAALAKLDASGVCAGTAAATLAADFATDMVSQLDGAWNAAVYCDGTVAIDPDGDDLGAIPTSKDRLRCADTVAKSLGKLMGGVLKCHVKAADAAFKGKPFDEESCEVDPPGVTGKGARGKFGATIQKLTTAGICPPCLGPSRLNSIGDTAVSNLDQANDRLYPCATTTTTATSTTTTTTIVIAPCTPIAGSARTFSFSFAAPGGLAVAGITVFVDYPEGQVVIPGSGGATSVKQSITNLPQGAFSAPNDLDYALRESVASSSALPPGRIFTVQFQDCEGATPPTPADFTCTVESASDPDGNSVPDVICSVSAP